MKLETLFHKGLNNRPLVIFIHGFGMDMRMWTDPSEVRVLGGLYPLKVLLPGFMGETVTSFSDLKAMGFSLLTWTQGRPFGPLSAAVSELDALVKEYGEYASEGTILIGHSRGGLVGRAYLENKPGLILGLITVATPHHGSGMAGWSVHLSPMASFIEKLLGEGPQKKYRKAFRRTLNFFNSEGIKELLPDSTLYSGFKDRPETGVKCVSTGGTNPDLVRIMDISIAELFQKVMPDSLIPEEMKAGLGDGLVSAASSELPYALHHTNFHANHVSILFDKDARAYISESVQTFRTCGCRQ